MSVAIGMTLPDGALVIADSLVVPHHRGEPPGRAYEAGKIEEVCPGVVAVRFGVEENAANVIACLRAEAASLWRPCDVRDQLDRLVDGEWAALQASGGGFNPDVLGVGVLIAGILSGTPFLAASVRHTERPKQVYLEDAGGLWIIGGSSEATHGQFYEEAKQVGRRCPWEPHRGPVNCLVGAWLGVAWKAVAAIAEASEGISGGTVRAAVVRTGYGTRKYAFGDPQTEALKLGGSQCVGFTAGLVPSRN